MDTRVKIISTTLAFLICIVTTSCEDKNVRDDKRSEDVTAALAAVDDSVAVNSPHVLEMIKHGLENSSDSLEYHDWYLRYLRYTVQQDVADLQNLNWRQTYRYLSGLEHTPRVNGMMGIFYNTQGSYYQKLHHNPEKSIKAFKSAYDRLLESDMKQRLPDVCANLGDAYIFANDMPHAAMWYRRALFIADSLHLPAKDEITLYMGLGRIYLNLGDNKMALDCYKTADRNFPLMSLNMQLYFLTNYGNYYYYTEDYKKAEAIFRRMEKLLVTNGMQNSYEMYVNKINMADVLLNLGETDRSKQLLDEVDEYFHKLGDETAIYYYNTICIGLALKAGDITTVKRILEQEKPVQAIDFNLVNIRQRYMREYLVKRGDYKKAYQILEDDVRRNDSLKHNIANMRASEIMMRYSQDTLKLHDQILIKEKDAHIHEAYLWLYVGILLIVVLVLLLLFGFTYLRKRRLQMHMQLMHTQLASVRSRISPHFIFNVLNNRIAKTDAKDADELMTLAKLIRANLNISGKYYLSLKEELDFVDYYISIERKILGNDFTYEVDAPTDDKLEKIMVPSMFIQILVENSIKHGLKDLQGPKRLKISIAKNETSCTITVTDNGKGFDIRRSNPSSTKTGMKVIRNTINVLNHENKRKIRLGIKNLEAPDGTVTGCQVTLELPLGLKTVYDMNAK
mgnify:CR=1 FL=1